MDDVMDDRYVSPQGPLRWMGRLDLHLLDRYYNTVALIEFSVRDEFISVWWGERTLSVMDRQRFRKWFWQPVGVLQIDDLAWSVEGERLGLSLDGSEPFFVPNTFVQQMASCL